MHPHSRAHDGRGRTPRPRARHRRKGGPLRGLLRQAWRHPVAFGATVAAVGWLLGGDNRTPINRHEPARARRAVRSQASGAGRAINGEASHG